MSGPVEDGQFDERPSPPAERRTGLPISGRRGLARDGDGNAQAIEDASTVGKWPRTPHWSTRALDLVIASTVLVAIWPLMLLIAILIKATSPGPVLFRQTRVGLRQQPFPMLKFRTMYVNCDDSVHRQFVTGMLTHERSTTHAPGGLFKLDGDRRITRIGGLLRRTSLDELPQLFNVLRGEMALVGPRPALAWEVALYEPHHRLRFLVKPGMTGLWQVSGRNRLSMKEALELDVLYARHRNFWLDLRILAMTPPAVLKGSDAR